MLAETNKQSPRERRVLQYMVARTILCGQLPAVKQVEMLDKIRAWPLTGPSILE